MDNAQKEIYFASRYHDQHVLVEYTHADKGVQSTYLMVTLNISVWKTGFYYKQNPSNGRDRQVFQAILPTSRFDLTRLLDLSVSLMVKNKHQ